VSFFQFLIWGVSARLLISLRIPIARMLGADASAAQSIQLPHIPFATVAVFMAFFLAGFLLYSAMFARWGRCRATSRRRARPAARDLPADDLVFVDHRTHKRSESTFAKTLSLVPFTSPIATPFGGRRAVWAQESS